MIIEAHLLATELRRARLTDQRDPDFLHPGRCALIMMDDLRKTNPVLIAAATLVESERAELAVPFDQIEPRLDPGVIGLAAGVPVSGTEGLAEVLVTASEDVRLLALVERLDHLRHAHLWADAGRRASAHAEARDIYLPVAERTDPTLARRYRWWCSMFARRHLKG